MSLIKIHISISAPIERVFDLSRSIDLHKKSTEHTGEMAVDGVISGLIGLGQSVTWKARHFGVWQRLTSKITKFEYPNYFQDCMVSGAFRYFTHDHFFKVDGGSTLVTDRFEFASPFGPIGRIVDIVVMERYLSNLLISRNNVIKNIAESSDWKLYLK